MTQPLVDKHTDRVDPGRGKITSHVGVFQGAPGVSGPFGPKGQKGSRARAETLPGLPGGLTLLPVTPHSTLTLHLDLNEDIINKK